MFLLRYVTRPTAVYDVVMDTRICRLWVLRLYKSTFKTFAHSVIGSLDNLKEVFSC